MSSYSDKWIKMEAKLTFAVLPGAIRDLNKLSLGVKMWIIIRPSESNERQVIKVTFYWSAIKFKATLIFMTQVLFAAETFILFFEFEHKCSFILFATDMEIKNDPVYKIL